MTDDDEGIMEMQDAQIEQLKDQLAEAHAKLDCARNAFEEIVRRVRPSGDITSPIEMRIAREALQKLGAQASPVTDTHARLREAAELVIASCDFTELGGNAQDAYHELEQVLEDMDAAHAEKERKDG